MYIRNQELSTNSMKYNCRMANKWKFFLRWEIEDAVAKFATGNVESEVFDERGFLWTVAAKRTLDEGEFGADFVIRCGVSHNRPWKCDATVDMYHYYADGTNTDYAWDVSEKRVCFNSDRTFLRVDSGVLWSCYTSPEYLNNDTAIFAVIISARREIFAAPNRMSNVVLKIGDERIHVSKEYLAIQSPVFEAMFFLDSTEKGKEEVEIKDVVYEEFVDLLHLIYLGTMKITDQTVLHILKLAVHFKMGRIVKVSRMHLMYASYLSQMKKLLIADQYGFTDLKNRCLQSFTCSTDLVEQMKAFPECVNFSSDLKIEIYDKIATLKKYYGATTIHLFT